ncbi:MAG: methyl-accepting chemotaxis protein [Gemmatimonadetes bacterium]|nr:methyl-accepting chemotaxis protein [Gemmatimonadota bacterium]
MAWTIRRKLFGLGWVSVALAAALAGMCFWSVRQLEAAIEDLHLSGTALANHQQADMMHDAIRGDVLASRLASGPALRAEARAELDTHFAAFDSLVQANGALDLTPETRAALAGLAPLLARYHESATSAMDGRETLEQFQSVFREVERQAEAVRAVIEAANDASVAAAGTRGRQLERLALGLAVGGAGLLGLVLTLVGRSILTPIRMVGHRLAEVAEGDGDLGARVEYTGEDELGELARSFNTFVAKIEQTVVLIAENATSLAAAAEQMSAVSRQLTVSSDTGRAQSGQAASTAGGVSNSVQSIATGVEQLSSAIKEIARSAAEAATVASEAAVLAGEADRTVERLGQGSAEIGVVLTSITAVAQKTNLLALNATIEAARAGDAGKGFAVVAHEVKDLANQAAASSEDIARRIEAVQQQVGEVVQAIRRIAKVVDQINQYQGGIASAVEEQSAVANEMGRGVQDAAGGTTEIAQVMLAAAQTAEESSTAAGEAARTAADLARMSSALERLVGQFRTGGQGRARRTGVRPEPRVAAEV